MMEWTINLCFCGLTAAILLGLFRLARGPTLLDRILSFDLIATCAVGMTVLLSARWQTPVYLELILIFSLLGFIGTVAFVFHLHKTEEGSPRSRGLADGVTRNPDPHDHS